MRKFLFTLTLILGVFATSNAQDFNLISPADSSVVKVSKGNPNPAVFTWSSIDSAKEYTIHFDNLGNNFSNPIYSFSAGKDTSISFTHAFVDSLLNNNQINIGDSTVLIWSVTATNVNDSNFMADVFTIQFNRMSPTAITETKVTNLGVSLFPNPTNGVININGLKGAEIIRVINTNGKTIQTLNNTQNTASLTLPNNGLYLIQVQSNKGMQTLRALVK